MEFERHAASLHRILGRSEGGSLSPMLELHQDMKATKP